MIKNKPLTSLNVIIDEGVRTDIVTQVFQEMVVLPTETRTRLMDSIKKFVRISGFRNPLSAPKNLLIKQSVITFNNSSDFVKEISNAWVILNQDRIPIEKSMLIKELGFSQNEHAPLYPDLDKAFLLDWPNISDDELFNFVREKHPTLEASIKEVKLMVILKTGCLPDFSVSDKMD